MGKPKQATSYRLTDEGQRLIGKLSTALGVSRTGVLELAIRQMAKRELSSADHPAAETPPPATRGRPKKESA